MQSELRAKHEAIDTRAAQLADALVTLQGREQTGRGVLVTVVLFMAAALAGLLAGFYLIQAGYFPSFEPAGNRDGNTKAYGDWILGFLPVIGIGIGFILAWLGLQRLESYDKELARFRSEQSEASWRNLQRLDEQQTRFQNSIKQYANEAAYEKIKAIENGLTSFVQQSYEDAKKLADDSHTQVKAALTEHRELLEKYDHLVGDRLSLSYYEDIDTAGLAHEAVQRLNYKGNNRQAIALVEAFLDRPKVVGGPDDFFNLAVECQRMSVESLALQVAQRGLELTPHNQDLLSVVLQAGPKSGHADEAEAALARLRTIPFDRWQWRSFLFGGEYLSSAGRDDEARELYREHTRQHPHDERSYAQLMVLEEKIGRIDEAIRIGLDARNFVRRSSQIDVKLADYFVEKGDFAQALVATERAMISSAEIQPHANQSAMFIRRGSAWDGIAIGHWQSLSDRRVDATYLDHARRAIAAYRSAQNLSDAFSITGRFVQDRITVLTGLALEGGATRDEIAAMIGEGQPKSSGSAQNAGSAGTGVAAETALELADLVRDPDKAKARLMADDDLFRRFMSAVGRNPGTLQMAMENPAVRNNVIDKAIAAVRDANTES